MTDDPQKVCRCGYSRAAHVDGYPHACQTFIRSEAFNGRAVDPTPFRKTAAGKKARAREGKRYGQATDVRSMRTPHPGVIDYDPDAA